MEPHTAVSTEALNHRPATETILLVDDDNDVRAAYDIMLQRLGFRVLTAGNGREAVEVFRIQHENISLVLLDLSMPVMDGHQAFEIMTKIQPDAKVLVMRGFTTENVIGRFSEKVPVGVLQKPFPFTSLRDKTAEIMMPDMVAGESV